MTRINLDEAKQSDLLDMLDSDKPALIYIEKKFDQSLLSIVNQKAETNKNIEVMLVLKTNEHAELIEKLPNIEKFILSGNPINTLTYMLSVREISALKLTSAIATLDFGPLAKFQTLEHFAFLDGLAGKKQYQFLYTQRHLQTLQVKAIDLALVAPLETLTSLRVESTIKSETLTSEKYPHLETLHLHGCSRLKEHTFLNGLHKLKKVNISYNSHITQFPKLKNPELVREIEMYTCPNFSDIDSLLEFKNLERLVLTSHDKKLQTSVEDFRKLTALKKLKTVYTVWGRSTPAKDLDAIAEVYQEMGWIQHQ
jgi:hypothetical protein